MDVDSTPLADLWRNLHEMFLEATRAGFSKYEAAVVIGSWLAATGQGGQTDDG